MKIVKTDFLMQGIIAVKKGWVVNILEDKKKESFLIESNGDVTKLPFNNVLYNENGLYAINANDSKCWLNSNLEIVKSKELAEKLEISRKYRADVVINYKGNNLLAEALGVKNGQFGIIIKNIEDDVIRVMAFNQSDVFEKEDLPGEHIFVYFSKDDLTIVMLKPYCKNFMIVDNPLL